VGETHVAEYSGKRKENKSRGRRIKAL